VTERTVEMRVPLAGTLRKVSIDHQGTMGEVIGGD
jgi:hypothetical protein